VLVAGAVILAQQRVVYLVLPTPVAVVVAETQHFNNLLRKMVVPVVLELL
jgi:hypothetical protein